MYRGVLNSRCVTSSVGLYTSKNRKIDPTRGGGENMPRNRHAVHSNAIIVGRSEVELSKERLIPGA